MLPRSKYGTSTWYRWRGGCAVRSPRAEQTRPGRVDQIMCSPFVSFCLSAIS